MRRMGKFPTTDVEARRRTHRKLKALERRAFDLLHEAAGFWDEGVVSGAIDMTLADLKRNLEGVRDAVETQIESNREWEMNE